MYTIPGTIRIQIKESTTISCHNVYAGESEYGTAAQFVSSTKSGRKGILLREKHVYVEGLQPVLPKA